MEVWRDIVLITAVLGEFAFGFFLMARLGEFLDENRRAIENESERQESSCVMLTGESAEEPMIDEVI